MLVARYRGREGIPVHSLVNKRCGASAPVAATLVTCAGTRGPPSLVGTPRDLTGGRLDPGTRVRAKRRGKSIRSPRGHRSLRHPPLLKHRKKSWGPPLDPLVPAATPACARPSSGGRRRGEMSSGGFPSRRRIQFLLHITSESKLPLDYSFAGRLYRKCRFVGCGMEGKRRP